MGFFIIKENFNKVVLLEPEQNLLIFQKEEKSLTIQLIFRNIKIFMILLEVILLQNLLKQFIKFFILITKKKSSKGSQK